MQTVSPAEYRKQVAARMREATLEENVRQACKRLGLMRYHTYRSTKSVPGFPDDVIIGQWVMFRELKSQKGIVSAAQKQWLESLAAVGEDVGVWRPANWLSGQVFEELEACAQGTKPPLQAVALG